MRINNILDFFAILDENRLDGEKVGFKKNVDGSYDIEKYGWKNLRIHDARPTDSENTPKKKEKPKKDK